jgi:excisionase family DNA binding protein
MDEGRMNNLTVAQAAAILNVSNRRVVAMIQSGILEAKKFGEKVWQVNAESVERRRKAMASGKITAIWDDLESGWFMRIEDTRIAQGAINYCQPPDNQIIERVTGKSLPLWEDTENED